jgi:hypothetical protein
LRLSSRNDLKLLLWTTTMCLQMNVSIWPSVRRPNRGLRRVVQVTWQRVTAACAARPAPEFQHRSFPPTSKIQQWVQEQYGFVPYPYWISHCRKPYIKGTESSEENRRPWHECSPGTSYPPSKKDVSAFWDVEAKGFWWATSTARASRKVPTSSSNWNGLRMNCVIRSPRKKASTVFLS